MAKDAAPLVLGSDEPQPALDPGEVKLGTYKRTGELPASVRSAEAGSEPFLMLPE